MKYFSILLFCFFLAVTMSAQPGAIDKTYGTDKSGTVSVLKPLYITSSVMQPDNRLVLGASNPSSVTAQYILTRHKTDGSIDESFGDQGQTLITVEDLISNVLYAEGLNAAAVQPDGKIVATANITSNAFDNNILVVRILPDGTPDESFGSHGRVITDLGEYEVVTAVAVQTDGKILVSGYQDKITSGNGNGILLIRYNTDGTLDKTFGDYQGYTIYKKLSSGRSYSLLIQPDGKILTGGSVAGINGKFLLVRYQNDGKVDNLFGSEGAAETAFTSVNGGAQINSLALDEKERIYAAGTIGSNEAVGIARYLADGTPDNSFNQRGATVLSFNNINPSYVSGNKVLPQADNKLIVVSPISMEAGSLFNVALNGLNENGSIDTAFGTNKGQTILNSAYADDITVDAAIQSDNKIIISGNDIDQEFSYTGYTLARFNGYPIKVPLFVRIKRWLQNHTLSWKALPAEDKIAYYSVEQSANGTSGFAQVAKVSGAANLKDYSITNSHLLQGNNYYRIKAVSTDGVVRYSEVVSADNTANTASIYPNPARDYVTVQGLPNNETANISIKDGSGNVLARGVSSGSAQYRSPLGSNMQAGTYYLNITTGNKTEVLKFVKE